MDTLVVKSRTTVLLPFCYFFKRKKVKSKNISALLVIRGTRHVVAIRYNAPVIITSSMLLLLYMHPPFVIDVTTIAVNIVFFPPQWCMCVVTSPIANKQQTPANRKMLATSFPFWLSTFYVVVVFL